MIDNIKSEQSHWEKVMDFKNISPLVNSINEFNKSEQYKLYETYISDWANEKTFFEVWAAPWFYSVIFNKYLNYIPWGIEYTENWFNSIMSLLSFFKIKKHNFIKWDFLKFNSDDKFDIVFSGWFIEHFIDYESLIEKHIELTKLGWHIIILVPLNHFFYRKFQNIFYPWFFEKQCNLEIMDKDVFDTVMKKIEKNWKIKIEYIWGLWEASFWQLVSPIKFIQKFIYLIHVIFEKLNLYYFLPKEKWLSVVIAKKI